MTVSVPRVQTDDKDINQLQTNIIKAIDNIQTQVLSSTVEFNELYFSGTSGYGGTSVNDTKIRNFGTLITNLGTAITYTIRGAANADFFAITVKGRYTLSRYDFNTGAAGTMGFSVNSTQTSTNVDSITPANRLCVLTTVNSQNGFIGTTVSLNVGDIIRCHDNGDMNANSVNTTFRITKVD